MYFLFYFFYLGNFKGVTLATAEMYIFRWDFVSPTFYSNAKLTQHKSLSTFFPEQTLYLGHGVSRRNLSLWLHSFSIIVIYLGTFYDSK